MKVAGHIQLRPGPMEVGPHGVLQNLADAVKIAGQGNDNAQIGG